MADKQYFNIHKKCTEKYLVPVNVIKRIYQKCENKESE